MIDKQGQIAYFEGLLAEHGPNYKALDWNSVASQHLRYKILKEIFIYGKKAAGISVLDVGCGLGDLYGFFKAEGILSRNRIDYTGYDIAPRLIDAAKKKYPEARLEVLDILQERYLGKYDYLICSGIFNIRTDEEEVHLEHVREMLFRAYDLANCGVAVNFLSQGGLPIGDLDEMNSGRYYYFDPERIMNYVRLVCSRFMLRHDYHPNDFTVYLFK
jgi:SAM-dependent methyltransferase